MSRSVAQKLIADHLLSGAIKAEEEIGLSIDQTLWARAASTQRSRLAPWVCAW